MTRDEFRTRYFHDLYSSSRPDHDEDRDALEGRLERVRGVTSTLIAQEGGYQPFYQFNEDYEASYRKDLLSDAAAIVVEYYKDIILKGKVRILDVGCNSGFVSMKLAETFDNVLGVDISSTHVQLCRDLAALARSHARFEQIDIFSMLIDGGYDFGNIDCVLLLNVIHQIIFAYGLTQTKTLLKKLIQSVDVAFVELATRDHYKDVAQGVQLPLDPAEIFSECVDCNITFMGLRRGRPLYRVERRVVKIGSTSVEYDKVDYSINHHIGVNRKYYHGRNVVMKEYRYTDHYGILDFQREVKGLVKIMNSDVGPLLIDWQTSTSTGQIVMSRVFGSTLTDRVKSSWVMPVEVFAIKYIVMCKKLVELSVYQNDLSPHNLIINSEGELQVLDMEQFSPDAQHDHFGFLLWNIYSVYKKDFDEFYAGPLHGLQLMPNTQRVDRSNYPDMTEIKERSGIREFLEDAEVNTDWPSFVNRWGNNIEVSFTG